MRKPAIITIILLVLTVAGTLPWYFLAPDSIDGVMTLAFFVASLIVAVYSAVQLRKSRNTGVVAVTCSLFCILLGNLYLMLHYLIRGFFAEWFFTISDLAYVGAFLFSTAFILWLFFRTPAAQQRSMKVTLVAGIGLCCLVASYVAGIAVGVMDPVSVIVYGIASFLALFTGALLLQRLPQKKPFIFFLLLIAAQTGVNIALQFVTPYGLSLVSVLMQICATCLIICYIPILIAFRDVPDRRTDDTKEACA